jgi:hypothetical protein
MPLFKESIKTDGPYPGEGGPKLKPLRKSLSHGDKKNQEENS